MDATPGPDAVWPLDDIWRTEFGSLPPYPLQRPPVGDADFEVGVWVDDGRTAPHWAELCWAPNADTASDVARQSLRWRNSRLAQVWHEGKLIREHSWLGSRSPA